MAMAGLSAVKCVIADGIRPYGNRFARIQKIFLRLIFADKFPDRGILQRREYGLFEEYRTEDADYIMLIMGSAAGTAKQAVDDLRERGICGLLFT